MKKQVLSLILIVVCAAHTFAKKTPDPPENLKRQHSSGLSFTENRGQVHDQHYKPRPDVLYGVMAGNMAVHIKNTGVSYQLYRTDTYKEVEDFKTKEKHLEADLQSIYRIDLNWLNCNTQFTKTEDEVQPGFSNYYLESCPDGALNVRSYKGVTLHNLYKGINLHYYEKNGELKHDYIVAPHADYKQIQVQVEGAGISVNKDGSLLLSTPLGKVQEGAPVVYQNTKPLKARWGIKNHTLSFEIENYDPNHELVIDPVTRLWATYYGGTTTTSGTDYGYYCATDLPGNVYLAGATAVSTGTVIATIGSHQSSFTSGYECYLAKFNSNGVRQWGTYYGGAGQDLAHSCATDAAGNVYLEGQAGSGSTAGFAIATMGSHQPAYAGGAYDAFLAKFNSNGVRQWGTYYGGAGDDYGQSCSTDAFGNVYLVGNTNSSSGLASVSGHQIANGGGTWDGFLVKFNASGVRQWGTFYGSPADDRSFSCAADASGNVYLAGLTTSTLAIATAGGHQTAFGGGGSDAYLVQFNAAGVRQWGTYYGGTGGEWGWSCATDASGNVYMTGEAIANSGTAVATPGSYQSTYGGGFRDAFLVKFNTGGVRLWGTYYGGTGDEVGFSCVTDAAGNVYMGGGATLNTGTVIATPGSHQAAYGGGTSDLFLAKFDANSIRQSGTYYGGTGAEYGGFCATDASGNVYMAGYTPSNTGTVIATPGSHQPVYGGGTYDAFLVKFDLCDVPPTQPLAINGSVACIGVPVTYSTPVMIGAQFYTWALPAGWSGSGNTASISATPGSSGVFTLIAGNACGVSPERTLQVTVHPNPTVTVNSGTLCFGKSFTIVANGADSYTYSGGLIVSPNLTSSYTITGTDVLGCSHSAVSTVTVYPVPTVLVNSGTICAGKSFTMVPNGADTYTFSGGPVVSPAGTSSYSVTGANIVGCTATAVSNITVHPLPDIGASTTSTLLCMGETATLTASGGSTYTFEPGSAGTASSISPTITSTYTISGKDARGCSNTAVFTQSVDACTGINSSLTINRSSLTIYPNPTKGLINLELNLDTELIILNAIGQTVYASKFRSGTHQVNLSHLAKGMYIVKPANTVNSKGLKMVIE